MIYKVSAMTHGAMKHNFTILKFVAVLKKLKVINIHELLLHEKTMGNSIPVGVYIDYDKFTLSGAGETFQY